MLSGNIQIGIFTIILAFCSFGCASTQSEASTAIAAKSPKRLASEEEIAPDNALAKLANNKFNPEWTVSRIGIGPFRQAFEIGDSVKVKASPDGPTMIVEYVPHAIYVDSRYYSESIAESLKKTMRYRCRWKNKDGSESVGRFQEEELERVSTASQA